MVFETDYGLDFEDLIAEFEDNLQTMGVDDAEFDSTTGLMGLVAQILNISPSATGIRFNTYVSCECDNLVQVNTPVDIKGKLYVSYDDISESDVDLIDGRLKNATIKIYDGDTLIDTTITNNNGEYCSTVSFANLGQSNIKAIFEGTYYFDSCYSTTQYIDVTNVNSILLTKNKDVLSYVDDDEVLLNATVYDKNGGLVEDTNIIFEFVDEYGRLVDSIIDSSDENGVASVTYHASNLNALTITAKFQNLISSNEIIIDDCYYYDESSSSKLSDYTIGSGVTLSYDTDNSSYIVQKNSSAGNVAIINDNFTIFNNCILSADFKIPNVSGSNLQPSIALFNGNNGVRIRMVISGSDKVFSIQEATKTSESSDINIINVDLSYDEWYTIKYVLEGNIITGYLINDGEVISVVTGSTNSLSTTDNKLGLMYNNSANGYYYVKNIKVKELPSIKLSSSKNIVNSYDEDSAIISLQAFDTFNNPITEEEVEFNIKNKFGEIINISSTETDEYGVASFEYESNCNGDLTVTATIRGITDEISIKDVLYYDASSSNNVSRYTTSQNTISYDSSQQAYQITHTGVSGSSSIRALNTHFTNQCKVSMKLKYVSTSNAQWGIGLWNGTSGLFGKSTWAPGAFYGIVIGTQNVDTYGTDDFSLALDSSYYSTDIWYTFEIIINGEEVIFNLYNENNLINTVRGTQELLDKNDNQLFIRTGFSQNHYCYIKDLMVEELTFVELTRDKESLSYVDEDSCTLTAKVLWNNMPLENKEVSFDIVDSVTGEIIENIGTDITSDEGIASVDYQVDEYMGVLKIVASVGSFKSDIKQLEVFYIHDEINELPSKTVIANGLDNFEYFAKVLFTSGNYQHGAIQAGDMTNGNYIHLQHYDNRFVSSYLANNAYQNDRTTHYLSVDYVNPYYMYFKVNGSSWNVQLWDANRNVLSDRSFTLSISDKKDCWIDTNCYVYEYWIRTVDNPNSITLTSDKTILSYINEEECTLTATFRKGNNPSSNKNISFDIVDSVTGEIIENIGTRMTDEYGEASIKYTSQNVGDIVIKATSKDTESNNLYIKDCYFHDDCSSYTGQYIENRTLLSSNGTDYVIPSTSRDYTVMFLQVGDNYKYTLKTTGYAGFVLSTYTDTWVNAYICYPENSAIYLSYNNGNGVYNITTASRVTNMTFIVTRQGTNINVVIKNTDTDAQLLNRDITMAGTWDKDIQYVGVFDASGNSSTINDIIVELSDE